MIEQREIEHTKGPWVVVRDHPETQSIAYIRQAGDGDDVVEVAVCFGNDTDEARANADLLAAAPELLDALADLLLASYTDWHCPAEVLRERQKAARAAIAKAFGERYSGDIKEAK